MWIYDLEKALQNAEVREKLKWCCINSIRPCFDGSVVIHTSAHTYIKCFPETGEVKEYEEGQWRNR